MKRLAFASIAFMLAAVMTEEGKHLPWLLTGAAIAGLAGVVTLLVIRRYSRVKEDAALGIVLGLGQQLERDALRVRTLVREHQDFRRTRRTINGHHAVELAFRLSHVGVARSYDFVGARYRFRTERNGGDRTRPAQRENAIRSADLKSQMESDAARP